MYQNRWIKLNIRIILFSAFLDFLVAFQRNFTLKNSETHWKFALKTSLNFAEPRMSFTLKVQSIKRKVIWNLHNPQLRSCQGGHIEVFTSKIRSTQRTCRRFGLCTGVFINAEGLVERRRLFRGGHYSQNNEKLLYRLTNYEEKNFLKNFIIFPKCIDNSFCVQPWPLFVQVLGRIISVE